MPIDFSDAQKKAITEKGNVLVSAAAGSGKTAVLVERVIRMITDAENPVYPDRLLVVTFTNAAAAEMRGRIEKGLLEVVRQEPKNKFLNEQKRRIAAADICTVDSFCIRIVRENFAACGVTPDFKVTSGKEYEHISKTVISEITQQYFDSGDKDFMLLLKMCACEKDEANLAKLITRVYNHAMNSPDAEGYIKNLAKPYNIPFNESHPWWKAAIEIAKDELDEMPRILAELNDCAAEIEKNTVKFMEYAVVVSNAVNNIMEIAQKSDYDALQKELSELTFGKFPSFPGSAENPRVIAMKGHFQKVKYAVDLLKTIFENPSQKVAENISEISKSVNLFAELTAQYKQKIFEKYLDENILSFAMAEQLAFNLLCEIKDGQPVITDIAKSIISNYDEVLVDEYQDINDLQDMLFNILSDNQKHLFTVGDVKQSIYGFRDSNPENFMRKMLYAKSSDNDAKCIPLSENYRSREGVCNAVNYIFSLIMAGQCGPVVYGEEEKLTAKGKFPESDHVCSDVLLVPTEDNEDSKTVCEANAIADYIKNIMSAGEIITADKDKKRNAEYKDIAVLLSVVKNKGQVITDVLKSKGIPVSYSAELFLETREIRFIFSHLKVIENPKNDVELFEIMMNSVYGFTADEIAEIKSKDRYGSLYACILCAAKEGKEKFADFAKKMSDFRKAAAIMPLDALVEYIYGETDILNRMSAVSGGSGRRKNLLEFLRMAKDYSQNFNGGIYGFLSYLSNMPEDSFNTLSGSDNGVKVMTMHRSKGLQFPVCILAALSHGTEGDNNRENVFESQKYGISFTYYDFDECEDKVSFAKPLVLEDSKRKYAEEGLRKLYVACTRAIDKLCLVCSLDKKNKILTEAAQSVNAQPPYISASVIKNSKKMADWILPCLLLHKDSEKIKVKYGISTPVIESNASFNIVLHRDEQTAEESEKKEEFVSKQTEITSLIKTASAYEYPYDNLRDIAAKISVSAAANGREAELFAFTARPSFLLEDGLSAAGRGTAMHHVMQFINIDEKPNVQSEIKRLVEMQFITKAQADAVDFSAIERFFESNVYGRIHNSDFVKREMRFLTEVPVKEVYPDAGNIGDDIGVLVQGAVDLCFEEGGEIVVLDYKTDKVPDMKTLAERYGKQLDIYSKACEKLMGKKVKQRIIYSFHLSDFIVL